MTAPGDRPLWSILIPTLTRRELMFLDLVGGILRQAEASDAPVEVVALQNNGEKTLAEYREALLRDARGQWLCYVDDDDRVADNYVEEITKALAVDPDVVAFAQFCTGTQAPVTFFGLAYQGEPWGPVLVNGMPAYVRAFSHVQPVRAEIAKKGTFLAEGMPGYTQEDQVFAASVVPLLMDPRRRREARLPQVLYAYLYRAAGDSTQDGLQRMPEIPGHERPVIDSPCFRWCDA